MSQSIKSINNNKQRAKANQRYDNNTGYDDAMVSEIGARIYRSFIKRHGNNPNILFRSLQHKNNLQKSQLSQYQKKNLIKKLLHKSIEQKINYLPITDEFYDTNETKPNIFNLQFSHQHHHPRRMSKIRFNSTHRKIIMNCKLGATVKANPYPYTKIQDYEGVEVERVRNNRFPPRLARLDYTKPNNQVISKYLEKFHATKKGGNEGQGFQLPALTEISHLEELEKFQSYLLEFQSQQKHKILPKMSINSSNPQKSPQKPQIFRQAPKAIKPKQKKPQKQLFDPWQSKSPDQQYFHSLQTPQKMI